MNPYIIFPLLACIALETFQQISYTLSERVPTKRILFLTLGILSYLFILIGWFWVLKLLPLEVASPLMGITYITVSIASKILFKEKIDTFHWCGIVVIFIGVGLISGEC